jgi:hypothetical protein
LFDGMGAVFDQRQSGLGGQGIDGLGIAQALARVVALQPGVERGIALAVNRPPWLNAP